MKKYHMRRIDKMITNPKELIRIVKKQKYLTLAMCKQNEPYLVTLNYGYDNEKKCFYFHCASAGKKMDFLKVNPHIYGQVIEDRGYLHGTCDHDFSSVHFTGRVRFLKNPAGKRQALLCMARHLERNPAKKINAIKKRTDFKKVAIGKITITSITGKKYVPAAK